MDTVRPRVICLERGCGNITDQPPRCDEHSDHVLPRHPNRLPRPRYDAAWSRYSAQLRKEQPWCSRCGSDQDLTVDHIIPGTTAGGVQVLCRSCNGRKSGADRRFRQTLDNL